MTSSPLPPDRSLTKDTTHSLPLFLQEAEIVEINNLRSKSIHPGQEIFIYTPRNKTPGPSPDHRSPSASPQLLSPEISPALPGYQSHVVSAKESLSTIALVYGMKVAELKQINGLVSDQLLPGQVIQVRSQPATNKQRRHRSQSVDSRKVLRVFTDHQAVPVPAGTIPVIVGPDQTLDQIAERFSSSVCTMHESECAMV